MSPGCLALIRTLKQSYQWYCNRRFAEYERAYRDPYGTWLRFNKGVR